MAAEYNQPRRIPATPGTKPPEGMIPVGFAGCEPDEFVHEDDVEPWLVAKYRLEQMEESTSCLMCSMADNEFREKYEALSKIVEDHRKNADDWLGDIAL